MPLPGIHGASGALNFTTVAEAHGVFEQLAAAGKVPLLFAPSFWSRGFGMRFDRVGTPWIVNGELLI